jgi:hypothetical protein
MHGMLCDTCVCHDSETNEGWRNNERVSCERVDRKEVDILNSAIRFKFSKNLVLARAAAGERGLA